MPHVWEVTIGGAYFCTYDSTLASRPSLLKDCVDHTVHVPKDKKGFLFFDRDPKHFRLILNYLNSNGDVELPEDVQELREILKEAEFYRMKGLLEIVEKKMAEVDHGFRVLKKSESILEMLMKANKDVAVILAPFYQDTIRQFSSIKIKNFINKYKNHVEFVMEDVQKDSIVTITETPKKSISVLAQIFNFFNVSRKNSVKKVPRDTGKTAGWALQLYPRSGRKEEIRLIKSDFFEFINEADQWFSGLYHLE